MADILSVRMTVRGATALVHPLVYGVPSPLSAFGFVGALTGKLAGVPVRDDPAEGFKGTLHYVIHDHNMRGKTLYGTFAPNQIRSAERDVGGEIQLDVPRCDLRITVSFDLPDKIPRDRERIEKLLGTLRFAGGRIEVESIRFYDEWDLKRWHETSRAEKAGSPLPFGYAVCPVDKAEFLPDRRSDDPAKSLVDAVAAGRAAGRHIAPTLLGYSFIEKPKEKPWHGGDLPHAYAEPLLSTVEFRPLRKSSLENDRWRYVGNGDLIAAAPIR